MLISDAIVPFLRVKATIKNTANNGIITNNGIKRNNS